MPQPQSEAGPPRVVVVGGGMVGHKFVTQLAQEAPDAQITVIGEEPRLAYDRVHLSSYFEDGAPALALATPEQYAGLGVRVVQAQATGIDLTARAVQTPLGEVPYDTLVLATGSSPFVPPLEGKDAAGCFVYRTIEDLEALRAYARGKQSGIVVGGGLLGLEAAGALQKLGLAAHVVEMAPRLMPVQLDDAAGAMLRRHIEALGVTVHLGKSTERVLVDGGAARGLAFKDEAPLEADLIVFSAGIRPRDELARSAGLSVGPRGGIEIDAQCRTSDPQVFAIGECALFEGRVYGLVAPGYDMARVAARTIAGEDSAFSTPDLNTKLKLLGVEVASFGDAFAQTAGAEEVVLRDPLRGTYKKLVLSADGARLLGGMLVGDTGSYSALVGLAASGASILGMTDGLLVPNAAAASAPSPTLPDTATVCSCENVSKGTICSAVRAGAATVPDLKKATCAGTGCGGCVPLVTDLLKAELKALGQSVSSAICEHFDHSRQELFDLVRLRGYTSFEALLQAHGRGLGCEVCKPAVASILASQQNAHVLDAPLAPLQDTNDAYLANMQRDGTYSVVPRVPGGEITPDKLMALGEVAQKYRLYCKITGGQRIDLLGARVEQLPHIWSELIAAGFESGHAYGKSLRTVKSCVGQTWCRYGVQDSTSLAIRLEERYRGLRAPHKLKGGVSGCTRECAEAQGKDFGVIATERGWNLYVCGNGGMRPKHAVLLAGDLDEDTLIRYLDRFLMYYVRTADRLQRTSVWLEKLEGGLDYLRRVVVDDVLGLGAELEADMERHVASYFDEWQATLGDPAKLARFRAFVNVTDPDPSIEFVEERGQYRPAFDHERVLPLPML